MRIVAISDTHGRQAWTIPPCDVFIHAGDITGRGSLQETAVFATKLRERMDSPDGPQQAIIVPGNHDLCFELFAEPTLALFGPRVHVLLNDSLTLDGIRFFGSP
ncbi:MAG: metallophosphoesterase [Janthinobacterium lividum]